MSWKKPISLALSIVLLLCTAACQQVEVEQTTEERVVVQQGSDTAVSEQVSLTDIPTYDGEPYVEISGNQPDFTEEERQSTQAFSWYSDLDALGRCGQAYANLGRELQPTEPRGEIGQIRPSGWHTVKYNDLIDGNYLYNRCHLIGYQLAGENDNEKNLITGTRYLNVMGMLPFENEVDDYIEATGNHVLYRVTPVYEGDNLVASGVRMEGWSVEDGGVGICFSVYCYNVQPGIGIDYATGDSWESTEEQTAYIVNMNTKKFHRPDCSSVNRIAEHNKCECSSTPEELMAQGYEPCQRCLGGI